MKIGIISQARMTSTRLPGKVLMASGGKTLMEWHIERLKQSGIEVVVATTENSSDEPIVELCEKKQVKCFRGDESDVLSRYYLASQKYNFDHVVRVTSDCPLIDSELIKMGLRVYLNTKSERKYLSLSLSKTFPRGFDFEVFPVSLLREAFINAKEPFEREHVTPYLYYGDNKGIELLRLENARDTHDLRITVDTMEDFILVNSLIGNFNCGDKGYKEIEDVLLLNPQLVSINKEVVQKKLGE